MDWQKFSKKVWRKLGEKKQKYFYKTRVYPYLYASYRHSLFFASNHNNETKQFFTARPNPGAGIGHQLANWIAGLWFSKVFNLEFAHSEFSGNWEKYLGLGHSLTNAKELKKRGYKIILLPLFDEKKPGDIMMIQKIISSYKGKKVLFITELDQFYEDQFGVSKDLQDFFYSSPTRLSETLEYNPAIINIACHIRRGDIVQHQSLTNEKYSIRFQSVDYFMNILDQVYSELPGKDNIHLYIYSQGSENEFHQFKKYGNVHFRINSDQYSSFGHLIFADILITSKSSFSYKPALISRGLKICPEHFWHKYPPTEDFILADNNGNLKKKDLDNNLNNYFKFLEKRKVNSILQ